MHLLELNLIALNALFDYIQNQNSNVIIKKLRIIDSILNKIEEKKESLGEFFLTKSSAHVEGMTKKLISMLVNIDIEEERKRIIENFLSDEKNYDFENFNSDAKYLFEDKRVSDLKRKDFLDPRIPKVKILLKKDEIEYLEEIFSDESSFLVGASHLILEICNSISRAKEKTLSVEELKELKREN